MYEARQNKEKVSRRIDGGRNTSSNRVFPKMNTMIIQKQNPISTTISIGNTLTHGTSRDSFDPRKKILSFGASNNPQKPSPPAWFTRDNNISFNLHVVAVKKDYTSLQPHTTKEIYVYSYNIIQQLDLKKWDNWGAALEWIYRVQNKAKDIVYYDILNSQNREPQSILKQAQHNVLYRRGMLFAKKPEDKTDKTSWDIQLERGKINSEITSELKDEIYTLVERMGKLDVASYDYACLCDNSLSTNGIYAAEAIKDTNDTPQGYIISHDLVRNEEEIVLFDAGMDQIENISRDTFIAKKNASNDALEITPSQNNKLNAGNHQLSRLGDGSTSFM